MNAKFHCDKFHRGKLYRDKFRRDKSHGDKFHSGKSPNVVGVSRTPVKRMLRALLLRTCAKDFDFANVRHGQAAAAHDSLRSGMQSPNGVVCGRGAQTSRF